MEIRALPKDTEIIEMELDILKASQSVNGSFYDFGNFQEFRGNSDSAQYFQTAFILIPFLKFRGFTSKSYDGVIEKGFRYLNGIKNLELLDKEALSVAAYAYALKNDSNQAVKILDEVEKYGNKLDTNRKCYKLSADQKNCDLRHTLYVSNAYLTMNRSTDAKALIIWLIKSNNLDRQYSNTYDYAVSTEAISKFLVAKDVSKTPDFTVTLTNDKTFNKVVHITKANQMKEVEVVYPDYTLEAKMAIKGSGYCSITKILQSTVELRTTASKFTLTVTPLAASSGTQRTVRICATYQPKDDEINSQKLLNVIYDVEIPSGYTYTEIVGMENKPEIKVSKMRF